MEAIRSPHPFTDLRRNLTAGLRLAGGRPLAREAFVVGFEQAFWLMLLAVCLELLTGFIGTDQPAVYSGYGLNYLGAAYLFDLLLMLLIARLAGADAAATGGLVVANLAVAPPYLVLTQLLMHASAEAEPGLVLAWILWLLPLAWQLYMLVRLLRLFVGIRIPRALSLALLNLCLSISSIWFLPQSEPWYTDEPESMDGPLARLYQLSVEDLFYDQPPLLEEALRGIAPQRPGVTDLYLVALGGYGLEKVFLNEVEYVQGLFDDRFDTRERSLVLVNNVETLERHPLANRHNLRTALAAIAQRMDPEEDLLFLFMTSHGGKQRFSVRFGPVPLDDLTPAQVRQALDDAGIRWRVIVVSSCYSGSFIETLKDPQTLVITAAAADRTSFGCGAQSEFTDFGTAYFKHALAQQRDFNQAFDLASAWVAEKEQRERREASLPQRYIGEAIADKLAQLDRQTASWELTHQQGEDACGETGSAAACRP